MKEKVNYLVVVGVILAILAICISFAIINNRNDKSEPTNSSETIAETENEYDDWSNPNQFTNEDYEDETSDNYQPINREFSFYNFDNFSFSDGVCILIDIRGYDYEDGRPFVYGNFSGLLLESGFISTIGVTGIEDNTLKYKMNRGPYAYSVVSQNGISFAGDGSVLIKEQTNLTPDCCVMTATAHFASTSNWLLVPAVCLDFSTYEEDYNGYDRIFVDE